MKHPVSSAGTMTALAVSLLAVAVAGAQDRVPPAQAPSTAPSGQQECSTDIDPADRPNAETRGQGGGNLSDKLSRSGGVICPPPGADQEIVTPPPGSGRTPVIPPPGSPGGDPNVRPK
jgi:hypothetical protein